MKMRDIETRKDIDEVLRVFYVRAIADSEIGYLFTDVAKLDLEAHLPVIGDFWDSLVFGAGLYQRHGRYPMAIHLELHRKSPLLPSHFERWLEIFRTTLNQMFVGPRASFMIQRAVAIGARFQAGLGVEPGF